MSERALRVVGITSAVCLLAALAAVLEIRRLLDELLEAW